jgi:threonine/homoserine/homoserine lactone efflux protein
MLFVLALALAAGSPGPSIAALVARVIVKGWRDVMPFLAAMWLGELLWLTLAVAGLSALAEQFHLGFLVLKYLGVLYLLYLAWKMWVQPVGETDNSLPRASSAWSMFGAGMALTLGNPKIMVFYLALLPSLIDLANVDVATWAVLCCVTVVTLAIVDLAWVGLAQRARAFLRTPRAMRVTNRVSAGMLGGAAGLIATP